MRITQSTASVRLYHLGEGDGGARTLTRGALAEALVLARRQPARVQAGLYVQTGDDLVAYVDLEEG